MAKLSKRAVAIAAKIDPDTFYPVEQALTLVKETATAKFDESIDIAVQLGVDPKKSDQLVRGSVVLPMTGIVFVFVAVMGVLLWVIDKGLGWVIYGLLLGWK